MVMRVVLVAFIIAMCPLINKTALADTKHLHSHASHHVAQDRHREAKLGKGLKIGRAGFSLSIAAIQAGELVIAGQAPGARGGDGR
jgi:hypothetical protein